MAHATWATQGQLYRNDDLTPCLKIEGRAGSLGLLLKDQIEAGGKRRAGELIAPEDSLNIEFYSGRMVHLQGVLRSGISLHNDQASQHLRANRMTLLEPHHEETKITRASVWLMNGVTEGEFLLPGQALRHHGRTFVRQLGPWKDEIDGVESVETSTGVLALPSPTGDRAAPCVLSGVPRRYASKDLRATALHLECPHGLDWDEIQRFVHLLGYCLGRRLVLLGGTEFTAKLRPVRYTFFAPWTSHLHRELRMPSIPPVPMTRQSGVPALNGEVLGSLLEALLDADIADGTNDAIWRIWTSTISEVDVQLSVLGGGLEQIAKRWMKSQKSKTRGVYMSTAKWRSINARARQVLHGDLSDDPFTDRILRKYDDLNSMGMAETQRQFFEELGLRVGSVENMARASRNYSAHGGATTPDRLEALLSHISAYRSLLNRVVLKICGWKGEYIDYSTLGFPSRELPELLGGPEGDGVPAPKLK